MTPYRSELEAALEAMRGALRDDGIFVKALLMKAIASAEEALRRPEPEKQEARRLTKKELEDAAFPVLRAVNSDRLWRELTYSSGPYEVTCAKHVLVDIARALESALATIWGVKLP